MGTYSLFTLSPPPRSPAGDKTIHNIGKRPFIRQKTNVRIAYDTPPEKVERALEVIRQLLDNHEGMEEKHPPRVFLNDFLENSINILIIYWYHPPDYWQFCAFHEQVCLGIIKQFKAGQVASVSRDMSPTPFREFLFARSCWV